VRSRVQHGHYSWQKSAMFYMESILLLHTQETQMDEKNVSCCAYCPLLNGGNQSGVHQAPFTQWDQECNMVTKIGLNCTITQLIFWQWPSNRPDLDCQHRCIKCTISRRTFWQLPANRTHPDCQHWRLKFTISQLLFWQLQSNRPGLYCQHRGIKCTIS
jgi:hypothetical protein